MHVRFIKEVDFVQFSIGCVNLNINGVNVDIPKKINACVRHLRELANLHLHRVLKRSASLTYSTST